MIRDWFREQNGNARGWEINQLDKQEARALTRFCEIVWPESNYVTGQRCYRRIMKETEWIDFDLADKILTRLELGHLWWFDPELNEIYMNVDLRILDVTSPTTPAIGRRCLRKIARRVEKTSIKGTARELGVCQWTIRRMLRAA